MTELNPYDVIAAWKMVLQAGSANPQELRMLGAQLGDVLERDGRIGSAIARFAATDGAVRNLALLADAASPQRAGLLSRLLGLADHYRRELEDVGFDGGDGFDDGDDVDELPA